MQGLPELSLKHIEAEIPRIEWTGVTPYNQRGHSLLFWRVWGLVRLLVHLYEPTNGESGWKPSNVDQKNPREPNTP